MEKLAAEERRKTKNDEELQKLYELEKKYGPEWKRICVEIEELEIATNIDKMKEKYGYVDGDVSELDKEN